MDHLLEQARALLADAPMPWAICGGYALELFAGQTIRPHGDIDVCVFEQDRARIIAYMLEKGWRIYEFRGMGKVRPIQGAAASEAGRNLMCLREDCPLVQFYPCEEEGMLYHQFFHTGMTELNYIDVLFSAVADDRLVFKGDIARELDKAILHREGMPCLAPEIALLHKASRPDSPANQLDFDSVYPLMDEEQRRWLHAALAELYPQGHVWNASQAEPVCH